MGIRSGPIRSVALLAAFCGLVLAPPPVRAATDTDTFQVSITIQGECQILAANNLDFGTHGVLSGNTDASTTLSVQCTSGTSYDIGLDAGLGAGATVATRRMTGPGAATIDYSLYSDAGRSTVWGETISTDTVPGSGTGAQQDYTIYGRVPGQTTPGPGGYTDTITVTVTF